jgi:hypothetical protein
MADFPFFELQHVLSPLSIIFDENVMNVTVFFLLCSRSCLSLFVDHVNILLLRSCMLYLTVV